MVEVELDHGRRMFWSSCVKPFINPSSTEQVGPASSLGGTLKWNAENIITEDKGVSKKLIPEESSPFTDAGEQEIRDLIKNGTFPKIDETSICKDMRVLKSEFMDQLSSTDSGYRYKHRLVAQTTVTTNSPPSPQRHWRFNDLHSFSFFRLPRPSMTSAPTHGLSHKRISNQPHR